MADGYARSATPARVLKGRAERVAQERQVGLHCDVGEALSNAARLFRRIAQKQACLFARSGGCCHHPFEALFKSKRRSAGMMAQVMLQVGRADKEYVNPLHLCDF